MNRLSSDQRFRLSCDYKGDFVPSPFTVTILDDSINLQEIALRMYNVAQHGVLYEDRYLAGSEADRDRHR